MHQTILRLDASMRREGSQSRLLADALVERLSAAPETVVVRRDLADGVPLVDAGFIDANGADPSQRTPEQRLALHDSDELVDELKAADVLVAAVPIYNFGVPAAFKAWIDMIARARETFRYTSEGPEGLLGGKKAYLIITSGGTRLDSEIDFVTPWLRHVLAFLGINDVEFVDASALLADPDGRMGSALSAINAIDGERLAA